MPENNRIQKRIGLFILAFVALCEVLVTLSYERGSLTIMHYAAPAGFAFLGMMLLGGRAKLNVDERVAFLYPAWYMVSRLLLRELYLDHSFYPFCSMMLVYGLAFPFAHWLEDEKPKTGLKIFAVLFGAAFGILAWIGVYSHASGSEIILPFFRTKIVMEKMRLIMGTNTNVTACIFMMAFVPLLWFFLNDHKRWVRALCLIALVGLYLGIALTDSLTVQVQLACTFAALALFVCQKLPIQNRGLRVIIPIFAMCAAVVLVFLSFDAAYDAISEMSFLRKASAEGINYRYRSSNSLLTMSGRTGYYERSLQMIADHPDILWRGLRENEYATLQNQYDISAHTHNAWLQTVVMTGIPGLLIALWFTARSIMLVWSAVFGVGQRAAISDRFLMIAPAALMINGMTECYVFTELKPYYNLTFFLLLGYALAVWRRLRAEKGTN